MDCGPACVRMIVKAVTGRDVGKSVCDEASEILPGRCIETRQLALALGRLLPAEQVRISFCFLFTQACGFEFYERYKAEVEEDRKEAMCRFYREAMQLNLSAECRSVSLRELTEFFRPELDHEFYDFSCRAALVLLDWTVVSAFLTSGKCRDEDCQHVLTVDAASYFGHFCILTSLNDRSASIIDPSSSQPHAGIPPANVRGGRLLQLPIGVFEGARRSRGTDEDMILISWHREALVSSGYQAPSLSWMPAFLTACYRGNARLVAQLMERMQTFEEPNRLRTTPLMVAAWRGHLQVVEMLLQRRADPDEHAGSAGGTALWFAAECGHKEIVKLLLQHQASPNVESAGHSALWVASKQGHCASVQLLLEAAATLDKQGQDGTALCAAAQTGQLKIVRQDYPSTKALPKERILPSQPATYMCPRISLLCMLDFFHVYCKCFVLPASARN